jgi:hypothetical protein
LPESVKFGTLAKITMGIFQRACPVRGPARLGSFRRGKGWLKMSCIRWLAVLLAVSLPVAAQKLATRTVIEDTGSREGRLFQGFFLFLLISVSAAALVHFTSQVLGAKVFDRQTGTELDVLAPVPWDTFVSGTYWHDRFRLGESADKAVTWFPVLEPIVLAVLLLLAAGSVALFIRALVAGNRLVRTSPH